MYVRASERYHISGVYDPNRIYSQWKFSNPVHKSHKISSIRDTATTSNVEENTTERNREQDQTNDTAIGENQWLRQTTKLSSKPEHPYMTRKVHPCNPPSTAAAACAAASQLWSMPLGEPPGPPPITLRLMFSNTFSHAIVRPE